MDLAAFLLLLGLLIPVVICLVRPLLNGARTESQEEQSLTELKDEREQILNALQELDFDHLLGKVHEEEYPSQRRDLLRRGAEILEKIDSFKPPSATQKIRRKITKAVSETSSAMHATKPGKELTLYEDDSIEDRIAARRAARKDKIAGFCPKCGKLNQISDKFCHHCGYILNE